MGRSQSSFSSEIFDKQTKKRCANGVRKDRVIDDEQKEQRWLWNRSRENENRGVNTAKYIEQKRLSTYNQQDLHQAQRGEKTRSSSLTTTMCDGSGDDVAVDVAAPAEEEWSPIREARPPPPPPPTEPFYDPFEHFVPDEPGASSDMDTEEDVVPLKGKKSEPAPAAPVVDARAGAAYDNVGLNGVFDGGAVALDRSGSGSFVTSITGEPAPKRKKLPDLGRNPVVQVTYEGLTRESKNILQQALQTWACWHSRSYPSGRGSTEKVLQSGTDAYSPALTLEPTSHNGPIKVWMDKPLIKRIPKVEDGEADVTLETQDKEMDVPLYDRACMSGLLCEDSPDPDGCTFLEPEDASRCFNCGSYSHALRSCPRPRAVSAIRQARDILNKQRGQKPRTVSRYYQCSPGGKFDDLKPGILSIEARKAIGIGDLDPPPWLSRMREIGYPPGYLEGAEEESSGVEIIDDDTERPLGKESVKDGNVEHLSPVEERKTGQKMAVDYPGINAPIPENADKKLWASPPEPQLAESPRGSKRPYHQISQIQNGGSGLLSPNSPARSWAVGTGDIYLREESSVRSMSSGYLENYCRTRSDGMESYIDVHGSNLYLTSSSLVNMNGNLSVDPAHHWSKRRMSGTSSLAVEGMYGYNTRSDPQSYHHSHSSPSGLASPIRGMFRSPSPVEYMRPPANMYSRHNYYHSGPQQSSPMGESPKQSANQAWLKAQSALDALSPTQTNGGLQASPPHLALALQNARGPVMAHHLGRFVGNSLLQLQEKQITLGGQSGLAPPRSSHPNGSGPPPSSKYSCAPDC